MSGIRFEQENHILDQINGRQMTQKTQISDVNRIVKKPINAPMGKTSKTSVDKSSRKAFGNVSNVLQSGSKHPIGSKSELKEKNSTKECDPSFLVSNRNKSMATEVENESNSKFFDEPENMYPIEEELMSDLRDSLTKDLFTIDDQIVMNIGFDSDMTECLLPNKRNFDLNDFL